MQIPSLWIAENLAATGLSPYKYSFLPKPLYDITRPSITDARINSQKITGRFRIVLFPICANFSSIPPTLAPPVTAIPIPWNSVIVPNVAINDGADVFDIKSPLNNPNNKLHKTAKISASTTLAAPSVPKDHWPFSTYAVIIATVFALAIMERSIPPIIFDSIIASARKPNSGIWNVMDCIFRIEYMDCPNAIPLQISITSVTPINIVRFISLPAHFFILIIFHPPIP